MKVVSYRIPEELKEEMKKIKISWSEEIRKCIKKKIREYKRKEVIQKIDSILENLPQTSRGTAQKYVREDRDSN